jgi:hypothetical protein
MLFRALALVLAILGCSVAAQASSTFSNLPPAAQPVGSIPDAVPMDQGSGCKFGTSPCATVQTPSLRIGQPLVQNCSLISAPFQYQECFDTSVSPTTLKVYVGTTWIPLIDFSGGGSAITGPGSSVNNDFACWNGTTGLVLSDCGVGPSVFSTFLRVANNLSDVANAATALHNLGGVAGPGSSVVGDCATWGDTAGAHLLDTPCAGFVLQLPASPTDATSALQTAVNTANGQYCLLFPGGTWVISTVTLPSGTCLESTAGWAAHVQEIAGGTGAMFVLAAGGSGYKITDLQLDGNKSAAPGASNAILFDAGGNTNTRITWLWVHDTANDGISYAGSDFWINNNLFSSIGATANGNAGATENINGSTVSNFQQDNNIVNGTNGPGLACGFAVCSDGEFSNNNINNSGQGSAPADAITAYHYQNNHLQAVSNVINVSGNNGIHLGGNHILIASNVAHGILQKCFVANGTAPYATGTITLTNGSQAATGSGTAWAGLSFPVGGFGTELFVAGQDVTIANLGSNTTLTLTTPWSGTTGTYSYSMKASMPISVANITGNTCDSPGMDGVDLILADSSAATGNTIIGSAGGLGVWCDRCTNSSISGGSYTGNNSGNVYVSAPHYDTTVTVSTSSATVTGTGFQEHLPWTTSAVWMRVLGDPAIYNGTVTNDTTITLTTPYTSIFLTGSQSATIAYQPPTNDSVTGVTANGSTHGPGITMLNTQLSSATGNVAENNSQQGIVEFGAAYFDTTAPNKLIGNGIAQMSILQPTPVQTLSGCGTAEQNQIVGTPRHFFFQVDSGFSTCVVHFGPAWDANNIPICSASDMTRAASLSLQPDPGGAFATLLGTPTVNDFIVGQCTGISETSGP